MRSKSILLFALLNLFHQFSGAQTQKLDSLKSELKTAKYDSTRLRLYLALSEECETDEYLAYAEYALGLSNKLLAKTSNPKQRKFILNQKAQAFDLIGSFYDDKDDTAKSLEYMKKIWAINRENGDTAELISSMLRVSMTYFDEGNIPRASEFCQKALSESRAMNYKAGVAKAIGQIGIMQQYQNEYDAALENFQRSLEIGFDKRDSGYVSDILERLGRIYGSRHDTLKAMEYFKKAIVIGNQYGDITVYKSIGSSYQKNNDYPKALIAFQKSLDLAKALPNTPDNKTWICGSLDVIAWSYFTQGDFNKAVEYFYDLLKIANEIDYDYNKLWGLQGLASTYLKQKNYKLAKENINHYLKISYLTPLEIRAICTGEKLAAQIDSACGNFNEAYPHYQKYILLRDKLKSDDIQKTATREKFQIEYERKKLADKAKQDSKDAVAKAKSAKQQAIILFTAIGLLLTIGLSIYILRSLRIRNKQNKIISKQKEIVEQKNREITDSIEYALRIQSAILPPQRIIKQHLENSFILYKPKDIVAGDFYWMESVNDVVLFAACDCTGHGVPGAMVSVVCHNALNRAVREFGLTQPAAILDKTAEIVIENFAKSEEEIKDGMDISLVSIQYKEQNSRIVVEWAGANNPLWIVRVEPLSATAAETPYPRERAGERMEETKANKQPIGKYENNHPFTNHSFSLSEGDTIYIFTDGFADQFGGETGEKKLTRKRLKELLLSIQNKSMPEQHDYLDKFITDYRKEVEQIDDILVMGVRL